MTALPAAPAHRPSGWGGGRREPHHTDTNLTASGRCPTPAARDRLRLEALGDHGLGAGIRPTRLVVAGGTWEPRRPHWGLV